ncbi:MAG: DUF4388 domain-containing protein [Nannocystis sp.]|nr:DUF4388 domain-containing protein [Nannocystis sp.]MBA3549101.1 DUF4388 domain-containing protein [Nannocystis sp.]
MARQNLLLVDGYARNLRVLEVSLRKAGFSITTAGSAEQGLQYLEHAEPDLIISDTQLRGGDGFEFCRSVKQDPRWAAIPFIFLTSAGELEDKVRGLELGVEDYLTKPIYVKEVMTRVKMLLQRKQQERIGRKDARTKFSGQLADMAIVDLLQTIEISRKSGTIELETDLGNATVWFRDGKVIDAQMGRLQAAAAVYRLLGISEGTFEVEFRTISRTSVIEDATQTLLMEGMRRVDEWVRLLEGLPPLDHILTLDERLLAVRSEPLPSAEAALLRRFDGRRTIIAIIDDAGVDDLEVLQMIGGLYFEGLLTDELGSGEDELVEPLTPDPRTAETWDPAVTRAGVPPLPAGPVETVVPVATAADLPPLPAFPLPFPNLSANADHDDVLVGGIPEDVRELPAESEDDRVLQPTTPRQRITDKAPPSAILEGLTVQRLEAIDGCIAVPMGTARAEAFGELQSARGDGVPDARTHSPSTSIVVRSQSSRIGAAANSAVHVAANSAVTAAANESRPAEASRATASTSWLKDVSPQLLEESSDDMGRLSALVASLKPAPAPVIPAAEPEPISKPRSNWGLWGTLAALSAVALVAVKMSGAATPRPPSTPKAMPPAAPKHDEVTTKRGEDRVPPELPAPVPVPVPVDATAPEVPAPTLEEPAEVDLTALRVPLERAAKLHRASRLPEALVAVDEVLRAAPNHAPARLLRANVLLELGELDLAKQAVDLALTSDPGLVEAYMALGVIEQERGAGVAAIAAYERFLELDPKSRYAGSIRLQIKTLRGE